MTSQQLTALAIRILAIWLLVNVVLYLPSTATLAVNLSKTADQPISTSFSIAIFVGFLGLGLVVSLILLRVSKSALSSVAGPQENNILSPDIALQILGLFFIVSTLTFLPGYILSLLKQATITPTAYGYLLGDAFKLLVGAYLLVKPTVWVSWLNHLRGRS